MGDQLLKLYHALPAPLRSGAASLRGLYLRNWRYGPETERLVAEALEREQWSPGRWQQWQTERLAQVLHHAATQVPYYRAQWAERRRRGDQASWELLENWPVLGKEPVRAKPLEFVADGWDTRKMFRERTSGTTGKPIDIWWSRETVRAWYALLEARARRWHGVRFDQPWAILGGQPVVPGGRTRPPFWVWNAPMHQLYLSANHISRANAPAYWQALADYGVTHLISYTSSAAELARAALELGLAPTAIKLTLTNSEPVFPWQRATIERGLGGTVRETYGMNEIVAGASECPHGSLHLWPEAGWVEVLSDEHDKPVAPGEAGRLICTSLLNTEMPLIRYAVGDRSQPPMATPCACQRTLPVCSGIEGRSNDMLQTPDGRRVYWLNPVFYGLPIREAQLVQESLNTLRVLYVPAPEFSAETQRTIKTRLQARLGDINVAFEPLPAVPRGPNGKFQAVVCKLPR